MWQSSSQVKSKSELVYCLRLSPGVLETSSQNMTAPEDKKTHLLRSCRALLRSATRGLSVHEGLCASGLVSGAVLAARGSEE